MKYILLLKLEDIKIKLLKFIQKSKSVYICL